MKGKLNVRDFRAKGDGVANDTAAIQDLSQVLLRNLTIDREVAAEPGGYGIYSATSGMGFHFGNLYIRNQDLGVLLEGNIAGAWFVDSMVMEGQGFIFIAALAACI